MFPGEVVASWDPRVKAKAYLTTTARDVLRRLPHGYRRFPTIEPYCHLAVNGAIMGGVAMATPAIAVTTAFVSLAK